MADSDDEFDKNPDGDSFPSRFVSSFGLDTDSAGLVLIFLALFAPGLAIIGFAAAEGLTASAWIGSGGAVLGLVAGVATMRDFLRWRPSWLGVLLTVAFGALLVAAYS